VVEPQPEAPKEKAAAKRVRWSGAGGWGNPAVVGQLVAALLLAAGLTLVAALKSLLPRSWRRHDVTGKVALVTGGGSGIGRLLCLKLARHGARVVSWDVNGKGNEETAAVLRAEGLDCVTDTVDLCDRAAVYRAADSLRGRGIKVDILVNNAGIVTGRNFMDSPDEHVERTFQVNVLSHFWTIKAFLPAMLASNEGHIVTVASMAGKMGVNKLVDYCASKFAAVGLDESLRVELMVNQHTGVHTTLVCPYYINTGMFEGVKSRLLPILDPEFVASEVVDGILMRHKEVILPSYSNIFVILKYMLSFDAQAMLCRATGVSKCLDALVGRNNNNNNTLAPKGSHCEKAPPTFLSSPHIVPPYPAVQP